ncbi:Tyrosine-protein kinase jak2 [Balamuthia mandrillaris]
MESRALLLLFGSFVALELLGQAWGVEDFDLYTVPEVKPLGLIRPWEEFTVTVPIYNCSEPYFNVTVEVGGNGGSYGIFFDVISATSEQNSIWACEIVPYPTITAGFGRCMSTGPAVAFDELSFRVIVASDVLLMPSQSIFDHGPVVVDGWTVENERKQHHYANFWLSVGSPSTDFKGVIMEMEPGPLEGYVPGVSSYSFFPLVENLGPSRVINATCNIILSPSWATEWDAVRLASNPYCKLSDWNESIVECVPANQEPVPKNMVLNFWSGNDTAMSPKLRFGVSSPSIRQPITITTNCTTPYVYSNDPTPTAIPLGKIDAQVDAVFQGEASIIIILHSSDNANDLFNVAPVNTSAPVSKAMYWSVDLTNHGRSSSLKSRCIWNFSLPMAEHALFASNNSDCFPSFSQEDEQLMIQCVGDVHPQQLLTLDFQLTLTPSLPASFDLHFSVVCLDEVEKVVLAEHGSLEVVGGASGNSDADRSSKVDLALGLGFGLAVPVIIILIVGGFWYWRQRRKLDHSKVFSTIQTIDTGGQYGRANKNTCSTGSVGTNDLELGFSWEIPFEELEFKNEIGRGAFGVVWKGIWRDSDVAIKRLQESNWKEFAVELEIMQKLRPHTNVLQLLGVAYQDNTPFCITELMPKGNLWHFLQTKEGKEFVQTTTNLVQMAKEIAAGMNHLHSEGIVHRDLAARNLLLTETNEIKVSDFGLSRLIVNVESAQEVIGPLKWMAPECFIESKYSEKSDVWSYGITLWEIITFGKEPYSKMNGIQVASINLNNTIANTNNYS